MESYATLWKVEQKAVKWLCLVNFVVSVQSPWSLLMVWWSIVVNQLKHMLILQCDMFTSDKVGDCARILIKWNQWETKVSLIGSSGSTVSVHIGIICFQLQYTSIQYFLSYSVATLMLIQQAKISRRHAKIFVRDNCTHVWRRQMWFREKKNRFASE